jgi:hypothetical protein
MIFKKLHALEKEIDKLEDKVHKSDVLDLINRIYGAEKSGLLLLTLQPDEKLLSLLNDLVKKNPDRVITLKLLNGEVLTIRDEHKVDIIYNDPFK